MGTVRGRGHVGGKELLGRSGGERSVDRSIESSAGCDPPRVEILLGDHHDLVPTDGGRQVAN